MHHVPSSPFRRPEAVPEPATTYEATLNRVARRFIYDEEELDPNDIDQAIETASLQPAVRRLEQERHELEALRELLQGMAAHERTNLYHHGAWQATLVRRSRASGTPPEALSREEVSKAFEAFPFKKEQLHHERQAVTHYQRLLDQHPEAEIRLSKNIRLDRTDMEVLLIDLRARETERVPDERVRRDALESLDREFVNVIRRVPPDQTGKRFELEEMYLLRRLIHRADKGHLASVSHGTPREDLRADHGSVDVVLTAAGDVYDFQFKTFKSGTHREAREQQAAVHERAKRQLHDSATHLVTLKAEDVQEAYEASLRQAQGTRHTLADKYATLEPVVNTLRKDERARLLALLGMTEADLAHEAAAFEQRQIERHALEEELRLKREASKALELEQERQHIEEEQAMQMREEAIERHRLEMIEASERKRTEIQSAADKRKAEKAKQRETERATRVAKEAEERKREEQRIKRAIAKEKKETQDWPPQNLVGLATAPSLQRLGLLSTEWNNDFSKLLAAKKQFFSRYAKPKRGASPSETDKPNAEFLAAFPSRETFEAK
jgi:hypothetical protein